MANTHPLEDVVDDLVKTSNGGSRAYYLDTLKLARLVRKMSERAVVNWGLPAPDYKVVGLDYEDVDEGKEVE